MSGEPSLFSRASAEIIDLHRFFVDWFVAARADAVEFGRFETVMGEGLTMVAPNGQIPQTQSYPPADSLAVLLESFAEAIELGTPFLVPVGEMLGVVAAFEAAIASMASGKPTQAERI